MSTRPLRWGVLGASSRIYRKAILPPIEASDRHTVVAEASRASDGSDAPYGEMLARADVDAVYIPLPNDGHRPWILRALEAGKHVLCEKPLTMSVAHTDEVLDAAASCGRHAIEAYMWPHHPRNQLLLELARTEIGELRSTHATFSFMLDRPEDHRLDERGRGSLFDVGIYCLGPAVLLGGGAARHASGVARCNAAGVDVTFAGLLDLGSGLSAGCLTSFESVFRRSMDITGTGGVIRVPDELAPGPLDASVITVEQHGGPLRVDAPGVDAYAFMLDQFADVVLDGAEPRWSPAHSRTLARWIEALHTAAGITA